MNFGTNPCGEIALGEPEPVMPWIQIQWMNHFRVKSGLPPFTAEEIAALHVELDAEYDLFKKTEKRN